MDKEINFITFVGINIEKQMRSQHTFKTSAGSLTGCSKSETPNFERSNLAGSKHGE